ncbi:MAG: GAK system ATP-grasp enzyme [Desulfobacterales bacterium]|jgi:ribosomal protein S6--L-glutamate ligase|nr:GAK system ATP-grasp enzyme [Desulfobacterales bacterium]
MPNIAIIGTKDGWSSEKLADAAGKITGRRLLVEMNKVRLDLDSGAAWFGNTDLSKMDAMIIKKIGARYSPDLLDRLELLRFLEQRGVKIFSSPERILRVLDRLSCTVTLKAAGIPMPPTTITEDIDQALIAVGTYREAIIKPLYTSKARGMIVVQDDTDAKQQLENFQKENSFFYIQKKIHIGNQDLGLVFLGGEYLTTYARCKQENSWNTTIRSGGKYAPYDPPAEIIDLAKRAQDLFGLDFTCVDIAITPNGPYVFEVSAFGGFRGILEARDIDPANLLVEYVLERIGHDG